MITVYYESFSFTAKKLSELGAEFAKRSGGKEEHLSHDGCFAMRILRGGEKCDAVLDEKKKLLAISIDKAAASGYELIGHLAQNGFINDANLSPSPYPIECKEDALIYVSEVISGKKKPDIPIVYLSLKAGNMSLAADADEYSLAKKLYGLAHVIVATPSSEQELNRRLRGTERRAPYNGCIGLFAQDGYEFLHDFKSSVAGSSEKRIVDLVLEHAAHKAQAKSFDELALARERATMCPKIITAEPDTKLISKIERLSSENSELQSRLSCAESERKMRETALPFNSITSPGIDEARENEFYDFLVGCIKSFYDTIPDGEISRRKALAKAFLAVNPATDYERGRYIELETLLKEKAITPDPLYKLGFTDVRSNGHLKFKYAGIPLTISATPSDFRSRQNELYQIIGATFVTGKRQSQSK